MDINLEKLIEDGKRLKGPIKQKKEAWKFAELFGLKHYNPLKISPKSFTIKEIMDILLKNKLIQHRRKHGEPDPLALTEGLVDNGRIFIDNYHCFEFYETRSSRKKPYEHSGLTEEEKEIIKKNGIDERYFDRFPDQHYKFFHNRYRLRRDIHYPIDLIGPYDFLVLSVILAMVYVLFYFAFKTFINLA